MTAMTPDAFSVGMRRPMSLTAITARLGELLADSRGRAGWWVEVTRQLDDLAETVHTGPDSVSRVPDQLRTDAPHLLRRWQRLSADRDRLYEEVRELRIVTGSQAGDPAAVGAVSRSIRDVLGRVRRYEERSSDVLLEAYERDMGGE